MPAAIHFAEFPIQTIFDLYTDKNSLTLFDVHGKQIWVDMHSDRYLLFKEKGIKCVACGVEGNTMVLELTSNDRGHFNLYCKDNLSMTLLTRDHIVAKACGGKNVMENYQVMCERCNSIKGHYDLTAEQILEIKETYKRKDMSPNNASDLAANLKRVMINENKRRNSANGSGKVLG